MPGLEKAYGEDYAVSEAIHGTAPDIAGRGIANPIALILSGARGCHHLAHPDAYPSIRRGVASVTRDPPEALTPDRGATGTTAGLTQVVVAGVRAQAATA